VIIVNIFSIPKSDFLLQNYLIILPDYFSEISKLSIL